MFCDNCGQQNPDSARFCTGCGRGMDGSAPPYGGAATTSVGSQLHGAAQTFARSPAGKTTASVFGSFNTMVTPRIIAILFWLGVVAIGFGGLSGLIAGFGAMKMGGDAGVIMGFGTWIATGIGVVAAILCLRIACELMIVTFKIHEAVQDIRTQTAKR